MERAILLWMLGVPIPTIILLALMCHQRRDMEAPFRCLFFFPRTISVYRLFDRALLFAPSGVILPAPAALVRGILRRDVFVRALYELAHRGEGCLVRHTILRATKAEAEAHFDEYTTE